MSYDVSSKWNMVKLGEVCKYVNDKISIGTLTEDNYISTENMLPEKAGITIASGLSTTNMVSVYKFGDVLVSNIRPYFKKIWFADKSGGCSNDVLNFRTNNIYNNKFLYYVLSDDSFFEYSMSTSKGTKMPRGDKTALMDYIVPLPPLPEQKAIADTLSCLDDKIELNNRMNKTLEEMAQAIFKRWFVDLEFPDENGNPYKSSGGDMVDSEMGQIPLGWRVGTLGEIDVIISDFVANGSFASLKENVTLYETSNFAYFIRNTDLKVNKFEKYVDEQSYNFLSKTKLYGNEVIVSNVGDVGSVFLCPVLKKPMTLGNNIVMLTSNGTINYNLFMYLLFKYSYGKDLIKSITGGSAQPKFNKTDFRNLNIILPSQWEIKRFNILIEKLFQLTTEVQNENQTLTTTRDALLPKLMSGEIRVPTEV